MERKGPKFIRRPHNLPRSEDDSCEAVKQPGRREGTSAFEGVILVVGESAVQSAVVRASEEICHGSRRCITAQPEILGQGRSVSC